MSLRVTTDEYVTFLAKTGKAESVTSQPVPAKKSKYGNVKTTVDGFTFDSKAEASRYCELKLQQQVGQIHLLTVHKVFPIALFGDRICNYECDFTYFKDGKRVVEDVKGHDTDVYKIKKKLMRVVNDIEIVEIRKRR